MPVLRDLIWLVGGVVIAAIVLWGLGELPMDDTLRKIARVIVIVLVAVWAVYVIVGAITGAMPQLK